MYKFEELDDITRKWMLEEFLNEEKSKAPYRSSRLSEIGLEVFPKEMEKAIIEGNEESLTNALMSPNNWKPSEPYMSKNMVRSRIDRKSTRLNSSH